ncbi:hypothetical protein [Vibrio sp. SCSIO 43137]|uniref:hypothetical protein n=1 Tax=Vibrio sp. SCSIO 43137 TaxID=3021011 RepID=UPI0023074138|nr:hypothetical protein [Vibrio sp. SCSIO 43137]WCE31127.1 hypothetical protein PK654_07635 [Vibrio sp. SCSIO 43137]
MKYYLETNALRALGGKIDENKELKSQSYTSLFSIFELIKGIDKRSDSQKRKQILSTLVSSDLSLIPAMPFEVMKSAFTDEETGEQSNTVIQQLRNLIADEVSDVDDYKALVENYEFDTLAFQAKSNHRHVRPKPEPEYITLDWETMFAEPKSDIPLGVKNLPKDVHPSRVAMEIHKLELAPAVFRAFFDDENISNEKILDYYNDSLDLYFFASHFYELKKHCLRESAAKNDLLDILHTVYLFEHDSIMVSNDKIFESILPNINIISVEEYKKLI